MNLRSDTRVTFKVGMKPEIDASENQWISMLVLANTPMWKGSIMNFKYGGFDYYPG